MVVVFQQFQLIPYLTALENVLLPLTTAAGPARRKREMAERVLEKVGMAGKARRLPNQLSGGEQERVAIAKVRSSRREAVAKLKLEDIDYKRLDVLTHFITTTGKIEAARRTGANRKQQARVVRAVKRARYLALLPYVIDDRH